MDETINRLTDALNAAAPGTRVTVLTADLRAVLEHMETMKHAFQGCCDTVDRLNERLALTEAPDFRSIDAWLK